ncbi:MAG: M48 family metallopeptidase [Acholeplasmataceae bacterium]
MYFYLVIGLLIVLFGIKLWVSVLNYQSRKKEIPLNVRTVYDDVSYDKWLAYTMEVFRFSLIHKSVNLLVLILLLVFKVFGTFESIASNLSDGLILQTLIFLGIYLGIRFVMDIPFSYYSKFVIEARYGFNKTTLKTFILDKVKSVILGVLFGGGLVALLMLVYIELQSSFFIVSWAILTVLVLLISILQTKVFIKLFNKLTPLEDGELKDKIYAFVKTSGYKIKVISVMDASKRSTKLNAFFSGFGRFKDIVLFDTLVDKLEPDEIVAVLAHEIAHGKHKDVLRMLIQQLIIFAVFIFVISFTVSSDALATSFGLTGAHFGFGLIMFAVFIEPIDFIISIPLNYLSRVAEFKADRYAAISGFRDPMKQALIKLARENFSNLTPHPLYVTLYYSHPPIDQRLNNIESA